MDIKKYLPLGSVVLLKEGKHRLMIVGFCTSPAEEVDGKVYDYMGCFFPEGIFTTENSILFNHDNIEKIYYIGYSDKEEKQFKLKLSQMVEKYIGQDGKLNTSPAEIIKNEKNNE